MLLCDCLGQMKILANGESVKTLLGDMSRAYRYHPKHGLQSCNLWTQTKPWKTIQNIPISDLFSKITTEQ